MDKNVVRVFENKKIRASWDENSEEWLFSVVDIIAVLTDSKNPGVYWRVLKKRLSDEGNKSVTKCNALKMLSADGKKRLTDVATMKQLLRIIQSVPSKKAEPLKLWLAQVGGERIDEEYDPEKAIDRALQTYRRKGYSNEWINQRLRTIDARKEFTDELKNSGITKQRDFAILTNILTQTWSGYSVKSYKKIKGLTKENLRDNMTSLELALNLLAETSSTEISKASNKRGFKGAKESVEQGGNVAKNARKQIEQITGKSLISKEKHLQINSSKNPKDGWGKQIKTAPDEKGT